MAITTQALKDLIKTALDEASDVSIDPSVAREQVAQKLANAIEAYVVSRTTVVTGTSATGGPVTGTGVIQ